VAKAEDHVDCANAQTQMEMNFCAAQEFETADAELNALWKDARAAAKALDEDQPQENMKGAAAALLAAQRAWITYRDGQCELEGFSARGGTMEPMLVSGCKAELTRTRNAQLKAFIDEAAGN
jgi:uncharacterized protein YecT (DUF1311 family)